MGLSPLRRKRRTFTTVVDNSKSLITTDDTKRLKLNESDKESFEKEIVDKDIKILPKPKESKSFRRMFDKNMPSPVNGSTISFNTINILKQ
jgi:hypothetical protein